LAVFPRRDSSTKDLLHHVARDADPQTPGDAAARPAHGEEEEEQEAITARDGAGTDVLRLAPAQLAARAAGFAALVAARAAAAPGFLLREDGTTVSATTRRDRLALLARAGITPERFAAAVADALSFDGLIAMCRRYPVAAPPGAGRGRPARTAPPLRPDAVRAERARTLAARVAALGLTEEEFWARRAQETGKSAATCAEEFYRGW